MESPPYPDADGDVPAKSETSTSGAHLTFLREEIETSIPERFERVAERFPGQLAIKTRRQALTYVDLEKASNRLARAIVSQRGEEEEPVVLLLGHGATPIVALFAVLKAGKGYVALNPSLSRSRSRDILEDAQAHLIVTDDENTSLAEELAPGRCQLLNVDGMASHFSDRRLKLPVGPENLAAIYYTSGTTGEPKGVERNHRSLLHAIWSNTRHYRLGPGDRYFDPFFPGFIASAIAIFDTLLNGATLYPYNLREESLRQLASWLIRERITFFHPTVTIFRQFIDTLSGQEQFPDLRLIALAGESIYGQDIERFSAHFPKSCKLIHRFSSTESGIIAHMEVEGFPENLDHALPVGYATADKEILILDDSGRQLDRGEIGEIAVRSRYLACGYWRKPALTQARFLPDPEGGERRLYLMGDLGRMRSDGCLEHLGRKDTQAKIRGYTVPVAAVEVALHNLESVADAVALVRQDRDDDQRLVAYLVPSRQPVPDVSSLRRALRRALPDYMIPSAYVWLDTLPMTSTGKVDRSALPAPSRGRPDLVQGLVAAQTPCQEQLAEIWQELFELEPVGVHDSFFDLGGHSLLASRLLARIQDAFQIAIPLDRFFASPTIAELAAYIEKTRSTLRHLRAPVHTAEADREEIEI